MVTPAAGVYSLNFSHEVSVTDEPSGVGKDQECSLLNNRNNIYFLHGVAVVL